MEFFQDIKFFFLSAATENSWTLKNLKKDEHNSRYSVVYFTMRHFILLLDFLEKIFTKFNKKMFLLMFYFLFFTGSLSIQMYVHVVVEIDI